MYHQPRSIEQALTLKAELGAAASFVAGGTDFVVGIRKGKPSPQALIDLSRVGGLDELVERDGHLRIGATVTHARLENSAMRALAQAAATVGGVQIRNLGTVGGQIGTASPAGDVSVALLALRASVELRSLRGVRTLALHEVFVGPGRTALADDELIVAVTVPLHQRSAFYKIGKRSAVAISLCMAAVAFGADGEMTIAMGCVAPTPLRCRRAEAYLAAHGVDDPAVEHAGSLVCAEVSPITDHRGGAAYRRAMAGTLAKRLLRQLRDEKLHRTPSSVHLISGGS